MSTNYQAQVFPADPWFFQDQFEARICTEIIRRISLTYPDLALNLAEAISGEPGGHQGGRLGRMREPAVRDFVVCTVRRVLAQYGLFWSRHERATMG